MAQTSKRKRQLRRLKRQVTVAERYVNLTETALPQLKHALQQSQQEVYQTRLMLYAVLAQLGSRLEVTQGTIEQIVQNMQRLSTTSVKKDGDERTLVLSLVEKPEQVVETQEPAYTLTKIEDETDPHSIESFPGSGE